MSTFSEWQEHELGNKAKDVNHMDPGQPFLRGPRPCEDEPSYKPLLWGLWLFVFVVVAVVVSGGGGGGGSQPGFATNQARAYGVLDGNE